VRGGGGGGEAIEGCQFGGGEEVSQENEGTPL
jgi:hypothetical protein